MSRAVSIPGVPGTRARRDPGIPPPESSQTHVSRLGGQLQSYNRPIADHDPVPKSNEVGLWERPHLIFLAIAYGWSFPLWIAAWIWGANLADGEPLLNEDLVYRALFPARRADRAPSRLAARVLVAVYGPMIGGFVATRLDPAIPTGDLRERILRVRVEGRIWAWIAAILALVSAPPLLLSALTAEQASDGPGTAQILPFLLTFFVVQLLTSGTEEIGWRGYLTEKVLPGRGFWDAGWAVGPVWALWHLPVVLMLFIQQGMGPRRSSALSPGSASGSWRWPSSRHGSTNGPTACS